MKILVTSGSGHGYTKKDAFDSALIAARIADYNLIHLSSVIPLGSKIVLEEPKIIADHQGYKLYLVCSVAYALKKGQEAWAGIGWVQELEGKGGLFVEQEGLSERVVKEDIERSLQHMMDSRAIFGKKYGFIDHVMKGVQCEGNGIACALVAALYKVESWDGKDFFF